MQLEAHGPSPRQGRLQKGEDRILGQPNVVEGVRVCGILSFEGAQCHLIITVMVVEEVDEVRVANVAVKESYECFRNGRASSRIRKLPGSDPGSPGS